MSHSPPKLSQLNKRFKELRLLIAHSIVRNNEDIRVLLADIDSASHTKELLDEYSLRYFLIWLGTKYGLNLYTKNIGQKSQEQFRISKELLMTTNWYPFLSDYQLRNEEETLKEVLQYADEKLPSNLDYIGVFYESLTTHSLEFSPEKDKHIQLTPNTKYNRRIKGQFYTPPNIVSYCYQEAFSELKTDFIKDKDKHFSVLDPACGSGNFLVGFLDHVLHLGCGQDHILKFATDSLHGIDIDGRASALARLSILFKTCQIYKEQGKTLEQASISQLIESLSKNIFTSDSTFSTLVSKQKTSQKFDLVITNPPYISYGSRNQQVVPDSTNKLFKKYYPASSEYKIRLNSVFQDIAFRFCKPEGRTVLLVPDSFLTGRRYAKLRKAILENAKIISLTELPDNSIANATVGRWCVSVFEKSSNKLDTDYKVKTVSYCNGTTDGEMKEYFIDLKNLVTADHSRFQILFSQEDDTIFQKLKDFPRLKSALRGHTGIRSRIGQKKVITETINEKATPYWKKGLISGSSLTPFKIRWDGHCINTDPTNLFSGGFDQVVVENEKILVRQTGDRIIAAYDGEGFYHLNNIHSFSTKKLKAENPEKIDLRALTAILNSNLYCYLYRTKTRETGRALAQIDIETVEEMPIPPRQRLDQEIIRQIIAYFSCEISLEQIRSINELVYKLYGLEDAQIEHIEKSLTENSKNKKERFISTLPLEPDENISKEEKKISGRI